MANLRVLPWLGALLLAGCAVNPATGKREFTLVSSSQEQAIGDESHPAILSEYGIYEDAELQARVDSIGWALARQSELPNLEWHFTVLDDPIVNAFALPGGYIYVTRGILAHFNSDAQLAGVLGHEIGHVTARHSAQRLTQQQLVGLGIGIASIASAEFARYGGLAQQGLGLMLLKYGRDDENEADALGIRYASRAGYDPREVPATHEMLKRIGERSGSSLPGFLSTHPDPGDRATRTRALADEAAAGRSGLKVNRDDYLRTLEGVAYGDDPRNGYFEESVFYHPELAFQMRFPEGWRYQNTHAAVLAAPRDEKAVMQLSTAKAGDLSPMEFVAELRRRGRISDVAGGVETLDGHEAWVGVVAVPREQGTARLVAAFIRQTPERTYQILGQTATPGDAHEHAIFAAIRSFRRLTDRGRLDARPDRVRVRRAPAGGRFAEVIASFGAQALELDETALLNNAQPDDRIARDALVKIVEPGKRR